MVIKGERAAKAVPSANLYSSKGALEMMSDVVFPVTCPECNRESLSQLPAALIKSALLRERLILRSRCHPVEWVASTQEIEQIRDYLWAAQIA